MTIGMVTVDEVTELISRNEAAIKLDRVAYAKKYREEHPDTPYAYAAQLAKAKVPTQELAVTRKTKHELPPDTTAQIFWLKNRRPDLWRDRREVANQVSGHLDGPDMSHLTTAQLMLSPTRKLMMTMTVNVALKRYAQYELARRDFFEYAHLMAPSFYQRKREYLISLCRDLQDFVTGKDNVLVINLPPRHGKSRTASMFVEWLLGRSPSTKVMTGSYNETLSTTFSKAVRNTIQEVKADPAIPVYEDVFPKTHIKQGDGAMNMWALEGGYNNYLATSPTGTATGFGADIEIIDDLIKNNEEANNETVLDKQWSWFTDTMLTRLETGGKIIIIMTRWSSLDLAGRALAQLPGLGYSVKHVNMKALQDDGTMLCDDVLTARSLIGDTKRCLRRLPQPTTSRSQSTSKADCTRDSRRTTKCRWTTWANHYSPAFTHTPIPRTKAPTGWQAMFSAYTTARHTSWTSHTRKRQWKRRSRPWHRCFTPTRSIRPPSKATTVVADLRVRWRSCCATKCTATSPSFSGSTIIKIKTPALSATRRGSCSTSTFQPTGATAGRTCSIFSLGTNVPGRMHMTTPQTH